MGEAALMSLSKLSVDLVRADGRRRILDGVDLDIPRNSVLGILGESGSGKTTLAKTMIGWVQSPLAVVGGTVRYQGQDLLTPAVARVARARIGFIGADPGSAFDPTLPVGVQIAEKLRAVRPENSQAEAERRTIALLDAVRIPSAAKRYREYPNQYSGGMLQRALIVDAMVTEPDLLICDNIIQPLDVTVAAQIIRLLRELRERMSTGIVFISTSVPSIAEVADDAVVLAGGRIIERGTPDEIARRPRHAVTRELVARTPRIWTGEAIPSPRPIRRHRSFRSTMSPGPIASRIAARSSVSRAYKRCEASASRFSAATTSDWWASRVAASRHCLGCCHGWKRPIADPSVSRAATSHR